MAFCFCLSYASQILPVNTDGFIYSGDHKNVAVVVGQLWAQLWHKYKPNQSTQVTRLLYWREKDIRARQVYPKMNSGDRVPPCVSASSTPLAQFPGEGDHYQPAASHTASNDSALLCTKCPNFRVHFSSSPPRPLV